MSNRNFDLSHFRANLKASKPPYKCPIKHCEKVYRSLAGMQQHFDSHEGSLQKNARKKSKHQRLNSLRDKSDKKVVEIELCGQLIQFDSSRPLKLVNTQNGKKPSSITYLRSGKTTNHKNQINVSTPLDCGESTSMFALPEPKFKILDAYIRRPTSKQSNSLDLNEINGVEENIFYDADEEDLAWLELINESRHKADLPILKKEPFERVLDLFERLCHFEHHHDNWSNPATRDEDAVCSVCLDGECLNNNVILFCDLCNLAVHQECYGVPHIPDGPWTCRRCLLSPSKVVDCCLCPSKMGAMKQTDDGRWAHILCALWIPDAGFANSVFLEPVDGIEKISPARWKLTCHICKRKSAGACIQCHKASCYTAFHVTCAQQAGLHMKIESLSISSSFSTDHAHHRNASTNIVPSTSTEHLAKFSIAQSNWLKTVYCSAHTPTRHRGSGKESDSDGSGSINQMSTPTKAAIHRARKLVAEGKEVLPLLSFPTLDDRSFKLIQDGFPLDDRNEVMRKLKNYWLLKRRSRNGVPLVTHPDSYCLKKPDELSDDNQNERTKDDNDIKSYDDDDHESDQNGNESVMGSNIATKSSSASEEMWEELRKMKKLRQELERVRLLNELIRKRERVKLKQLHNRELILRYKLNPFQSLLGLIIDISEDKGLSTFMSFDDDDDEVGDDDDNADALTTDVSEGSRSGLDFFRMADIQKKVDDLEYVVVKEFENDFERFCDAKRSKVMKGLKGKVTSLKKLGLGIIRRHELVIASLASTTDNSQRTDHHADQLIVTKQEPAKYPHQLNFNSTTTFEPDRPCDLVSSVPSSFVPPLPPPVPFSTSSLPLATSSPSTTTSSVHSSVLIRPPKKRRQHFEEITLLVSPKESLDENDNLRLLAEAADSISSENSRDPNVDNKPLESNIAVPVPTDQPQSSTRSNGQLQTATSNSNDSQSKTIEACDSTTDWPVRECDLSLKRKIGKTTRSSKNSCTERVYRKSRSCNEDMNGDDDDDSMVDGDDDDTIKAPKMSFSADDEKDESNVGCVGRRETRKRSCEPNDLEDFHIPLNHGDFAWAQYAKFPAYPAIIIDASKFKNNNLGPTRSRTSRSLDLGLVGINKGDVIPVPANDIVAANSDKEKYLVCFFDQKRTWQWISRSKLDPLGVDSGLDRKKMSEVKRNNTRKPIIEAYKRALEQRCKRYGENYARSLAVILDQ